MKKTLTALLAAATIAVSLTGTGLTLPPGAAEERLPPA